MRAGTILSVLFLLGTASPSAWATGPAAPSNISIQDHQSDVDTEIAEDLSIQIDAPLQVFANTISETMQARALASQALAEEIGKAGNAGCQLSGVKTYVAAPDSLLDGAQLKSGEETVRSLRQALTERGTFFKVTFSSSTPPDPTERIIPLIRSAGGQIKALTSAFNAACAEKAQAQSEELHQENQVLSRQVKQIIDDLNQQVRALDAPMIAWAVHSLANAEPQEGPAAQE